MRVRSRRRCAACRMCKFVLSCALLALLCGALRRLMTPHIGGATHEAQEAIGVEVAGKLLDFVNTGTTDTCTCVRTCMGIQTHPSHEKRSIFRTSSGLPWSRATTASSTYIATCLVS